MTFDGIWTYQWDAENRLKTMAMTNVSGIPNSQRKKLDFAYDYLGRRISNTVSEWDGNEEFINSVTTYFVYEGWNLIAILNSQSSALQSFLWGQDLSGSMDEAGRVGGLLMVTQHTPTLSRHFAAYDANGNVMALVNAGDGNLSARYEYSPFGETLRATEVLARENPIRFSSKFTDEESGLLYYGFRYYSPQLGRWINRDPIGEEGGINLYAFVFNNSIAMFDPFGQTAVIQLSAGSLIQGILRNAAFGAGLNALIGAGNRVFCRRGTWGDVGRSAIEGMVIGGITGGTGGIMKAVLQGTTKTGFNNALSAGWAGFAGGVNVIDELGGGGLALDVALGLAGVVGGAATMTAHDAIEGTFDMIRGYTDRLSP